LRPAIFVIASWIKKFIKLCRDFQENLISSEIMLKYCFDYIAELEDKIVELKELRKLLDGSSDNERKRA
jgi:hypothetical protein